MWQVGSGQPGARRVGVSRPGGVLVRIGIGYDPAGRAAVKLAEAKDMALHLIQAGQPEAARSLRVSPASPDGDPGKFVIDGKVARAIHRFNGWLVPISLGWFSDGRPRRMVAGLVRRGGY